MAAFRRVRFEGPLGRKFISACGVAALLMAGCNRDSESTGPQANAGSVSATAARSPTGASQDAADAEKQAAAVIAEIEKSTAPPRKVVEHKDLVVLWDDPSKPSTDKDDIKPPRLRRHVKIYSDGTIENDGHYTEWYAPPGHQKMEEGDYVDGMRQGKWNLWHENGKLRRTENFLNGKLEGSWKQFRDDGTLESEESYKNNLRDGKWVAYDSTGKHVDAKLEYKAGVPDGVWTYYYDEATTKQLIDAGILTKDQVTALLENRQKKLEQQFKEGRPDGDLTAWYPNGKIERTKHFKNGQLDGDEIIYKENGVEFKRVHWSGGQLVSTSNVAPTSK
jgi:antitoxin component YwqK of YwqJK toxin-antitoxin module